MVVKVLPPMYTHSPYCCSQQSQAASSKYVQAFSGAFPLSSTSVQQQTGNVYYPNPRVCHKIIFPFSPHKTAKRDTFPTVDLCFTQFSESRSKRLIEDEVCQQRKKSYLRFSNRINFVFLVVVVLFWFCCYKNIYIYMKSCFVYSSLLII